MARAFADISFTANVKKIQSELGSRMSYKGFELGDKEIVELSDVEKQFIENRDSFYQATVAENGWPYVQHRGGPVGFLKVINKNSIGYVDFSGNRQYLSVGNLSGNNRICLILMEYQQRRRLKIWGRARIIDESLEPDLIAQLEPADSRAPIERGILITVEAYAWNCPKYITPRFSQHEVESILAEQALSVAENPTASYHYQGSGAIPMVITAIEQLTSDIRSYKLTHRDNKTLPGYQAGAHITVPVQLADGSKTLRSYSLIYSEGNRKNYSIAVKLDADGKGGSATIHQHWQIGTALNIDAPQNYFGLHQDQRPAILIAGGIGITVIMAMAEELHQRNIEFELHYTGKTQDDMAFLDELLKRYPQQSHFYFSREASSPRLDLENLIKTADPHTLFYVCGPKRLLEQTFTIADELAIEQRQRINFESFQ